MSSKLTNKDYMSILKFYKITIPKTRRLLKKEAEKVLAEKLCRCIKKIGLDQESRSIGICSKSVFKLKGLSRGKFTCKKKMHVDVKKMTSEPSSIRKTSRREKSRKMSRTRKQKGGNDIEEGVTTNIPRITTFEMMNSFPYGKKTIVPIQKKTNDKELDIEMGFENKKDFSDLSGSDYGEFVDIFEGGKRRK